MSEQKTVVLRLFRNMLRSGFGFKDYNFRHYIVRRVKEDFRKFSTLTDVKEVKTQLKFAQSQFELIQRQQIIQNMYHTQKSVMEI